MNDQRSPDAGAEVTRAAGDALALILASSAAQVVAVGLNLLLRRELGPAGMGYVVITQLALTYAPFVGLGVLQSAEREVPIELARGRNYMVDAAERFALSASLIGSVVAAVILFVIALALPRTEDPYVAGSLFVSAAILVTQQVGLAAIVRLRTRLRFKLVAGVGAAQSLAFIGLVLVGAVAGGIWGALIATVIASVAFAVFTAAAAGYRPQLGGFRVAGPRLVVLAPGFLFSSLAFVALLSADQVATGALLGTAGLGLYSAALLGKGFVLGLPSMIGAVIYPRLQRELGASDDQAIVGRMARRTTAMIAIVMPPIVACLYVALPPTIRALLPEFTDAIPAVRLLLLAAGMLAFGIPAVQLLLTVNRQWLETAITAAVVALLLVSYAVAGLTNQLTITTVAALTAGAYLVHGLTVQIAVARLSSLRARFVLGPWLVLVLPMLALLAGAPAADRYGAAPGMPPLLTGLAIQAVPFLVVWSLSSYLLIRRDADARRDMRLVARVLTG